MADAATVLHGKCYCGALAFEASSPLPEIIHCHCKGCRDWTGAAFYSAVPCATLTLTSGTPKTFQRKGGACLLPPSHPRAALALFEFCTHIEQQ